MPCADEGRPLLFLGAGAQDPMRGIIEGVAGVAPVLRQPSCGIPTG